MTNITPHTEHDFDRERLLALTTTEVELYKTKITDPVALQRVGLLIGRSFDGTEENAQENFLISCRNQLNDLEAKGRGGRLTTEDAERLMWWRSMLRQKVETNP